MQLQRGVYLLVDVLDAADRVEQLTPDEMRQLLNEVAEIMSLILERDAAIALKKNRRYTATHLRAQRRSFTDRP